MLDLLPLLADDLHPEIDPNAVGQMDHQVAWSEIQEGIDGSRSMLAAGSFEHRAPEDLIDRQDKGPMGYFKPAAEQTDDEHHAACLGRLARFEDLSHPRQFPVVDADDHRAAV